MQPQTSYLVCGTPRSGSTLLCEVLENTGLAGRPEEYFLPKNEQDWQELWGTSTYKEYLAEVFKRATTFNGVFGAKLMWYDLNPLVSKVRQISNYKGSSASDLMMTVFPNLHYIWIKRRDKVRQAISHARARQTNIWAIRTEAAPLPKNKPVFSFEQIDFMVHELEAQEVAWQKYFAKNGIQPFVVLYEDLELRYKEVAIQILKYLSITGAENVDFLPMRLRKQADEESEQWVQRYHSCKKEFKRYRLISFANGLLTPFLQFAKRGH